MFYNILNSLWEELARFGAVIALERPPGRLGIFGALWVALSSKWTSPHNGRNISPLLHPCQWACFSPKSSGRLEKGEGTPPPRNSKLGIGHHLSMFEIEHLFEVLHPRSTNSFPPRGAEGAPSPQGAGPEGPPGPLGWGGVGYLTSLLSWTHGVTKVGTGKDGVSEPGRRACAQA